MIAKKLPPETLAAYIFTPPACFIQISVRPSSRSPSAHVWQPAAPVLPGVRNPGPGDGRVWRHRLLLQRAVFARQPDAGARQGGARCRARVTDRRPAVRGAAP